MSNVKPIPRGYTTVTPTITVDNASRAIEFYKKALGATERSRHEGPDKKIVHAEIQIGSAIVMLNDEVMGNRSVRSFGGSPVTFYLYFENADSAFKKALAAGGTQISPVTDMFWGDRAGQFEDPFGYRWTVATHIKDLTPQETHKAMEEWMKNQLVGSK